MEKIPLWHHLLFVIPLGFGLLLTVASGLGMTGPDVEVDVDLETDADVGLEGEPSMGSALLEMMGVGRVPMTILMLSYTLLFGGLGQAAMSLLGGVLGKTAVYVAGAVAVLSASLGTGRLSSLLSRLLPSAESYASAPSDLVGTLGTAELPVSSEFGLARVKTSDGSLMKVRCVCEEGSIDKGGALLVLDFNSSNGIYLVEPSPFA